MARQIPDHMEGFSFELKPRPAKVVAVEDLSPTYRRLTVTGDEFHDFDTKSPADHIKLQLEVDGETIRRDYTPREFSDGKLVLEFALHADGPITDWARKAEVGSEVTVLGPRGSMRPKPVFDAYLFIGDETLLPGIGRGMEMTPDDAKFIGVVEVPAGDEKIDLPADGNDNVIWVERKDDTPGAALIDALRALDWPEGKVWVYAAGEASAMRDVRRYLLNEREIPREYFKMTGHWKKGQSNFDHHAPIEE